MEKQSIDIISSFVSQQERIRLVRLCATITGNVDAAEDLAQETLLEAWRHLHELRDPEKQSQWLSGIARNVCLRWERKRGHDLARLAEPHVSQDTLLTTLKELLVDDFDIEVELERKELIELLDRAMALLPWETRTVLVKRYVEESPLAEVAAQLGTNASAVAMRLQRGKLALRRVLTKEMSQDIASYDVGITTINEWDETSIWCSSCGQRKLMGKFIPGEGELLLRCLTCCLGEETISHTRYPALLSNVKRYKSALSRVLVWSDSYYRASLITGSALCINCGHEVTAKIALPEDAPTWLRNKNGRAIDLQCAFCQGSSWTSLDGMVLALPEGRRFRQAYPRIRMLPDQHIEVDGRAAIVTSFESVTNNVRLDVVCAYDTYEVLRIYGGCE